MANSINFFSKKGLAKGITFSTDQIEGVKQGKYHLVCYDRVKRRWINLKKLPSKETNKIIQLATLLLSDLPKPVKAIYKGKIFFQDGSFSSLQKRFLSPFQNTLFEKLTGKKTWLSPKEEAWAKRREKNIAAYKAKTRSLVARTLFPLEKAHQLPKGTLVAELQSLAPCPGLSLSKSYPLKQSRSLLLNLKKIRNRYKLKKISYLDVFHRLFSLIKEKVFKTKK